MIRAITVVLLVVVAAQGRNTAAKAPAKANATFSATVLVQRQTQFFAQESPSRRSLQWHVNNLPGGNSTIGFISADGLYTAPASVPPGGDVTVKAVAPNKSVVATGSVRIVYETQLGAPLIRSAKNPRYFENPGGVIYLTGSHTWYNLQDLSDTDPPLALDFNAYIDFLKSKNHNYTRLWAEDLPKFRCDEKPRYVQPFPWPRSGPGTASDGKPKFNLREFNFAYFERLRARVQKAQDNGIFVGVMLFEGLGSIQCGGRDDGFPFYSANNVDGIDAAKGKATWKRTGSFKNIRAFPFYTRYFCEHEWFTGADPAVVDIQKRYVAKVIETLNAFDNVLWEIANESGANSTRWQQDMIRFIREYEAKLPKQHPIGFTFQYGITCSGRTQTLMESNADWISPGTDVGDYRAEQSGPDPNDGNKVILSDTDHLWGIGGTRLWVWKSFMRGMNVLYMDDPFNRTGALSLIDDAARQAMGDVLSLARKLPLARLTPSETVCSTGFAMTDNGTEVVCLSPAGGTFAVNLRTTRGSTFSAQFFDILARRTSSANPVISRGGEQSFSCPSAENPCVLHLKLKH